MNINSLPPEIFTAIIRMVVVDTERVGECTIRVNHRKFACLVSVCKLWHSIIVDTPDLWKQLQCTIRPATLRTFLKRSQDAPLSIFRIGYPYTPSSLSIRCVKVLAKELHRIKDAGLLIDDHDWTSASRRLCLEAPMLESFDLRLEKPLERFYETDSDDEDCDDLPIQELPHGIFGGVKPPQLRHLSLQRAKVSWSSPLLSSLTTLKLHSQDRPSYSEFATVLGNMPCLAILGLHSCLPEDGPAASRLPSCTPLSLPCLRRLTLSESNSNLCRWFMEYTKMNPASVDIAAYQADMGACAEFLPAATRYLTEIQSVRSLDGLEIRAAVGPPFSYEDDVEDDDEHYWNEEEEDEIRYYLTVRVFSKDAPLDPVLSVTFVTKSEARLAVTLLSAFINGIGQQLKNIHSIILKTDIPSVRLPDEFWLSVLDANFKQVTCLVLAHYDTENFFGVLSRAMGDNGLRGTGAETEAHASVPFRRVAHIVGRVFYTMAEG